MSESLYFDCQGITANNIVAFDVDDRPHLKKSALILAEGSWKDNKGVTHSFSKERITKIAERSNLLTENGKPIGIYKDHKTDTDHVVGEYDGYFTVRKIKPRDLNLKKYPGLKDLVGKTAIFADNDNVILKDPEIIEKYNNGLIRRISPGINPVLDTIAEISITPKPAMNYATLFMEGEASEALTWEQIDNNYKNFQEKEEKLNEHFDKFKVLCKNISNTNNVQNAKELYIEAIEGLRTKLLTELELENPDLDTNLSPQNGRDIFNPTDTKLGRYREEIMELIRFAEQDDEERGLGKYLTRRNAAIVGAGGLLLAGRRRSQRGQQEGRIGGATVVGEDGKRIASNRTAKATGREVLTKRAEVSAKTAQKAQQRASRQVQRAFDKGDLRELGRAGKSFLTGQRLTRQATDLRRQAAAAGRVGGKGTIAGTTDILKDIAGLNKGQKVTDRLFGRTLAGRGVRGVAALGAGLAYLNSRRGD